MKNEYRKYFEIREVDWHENVIGTYHVSAIGISHKDIDPQEHYGPCLRATYWEYIKPAENDDKSTGNFKMGNLLHKEAQDIYKENQPNSVIEFPIVLRISKNIIIKGSVDILDFEDKLVIDLKSASLFTFPSSEYDYNPTYVAQLAIYTALLNYWVFKDTFFVPKILRVVYMKKHNLETAELDVDYDWEDIGDSYVDFLERVEYLDECLRNKTEPKAEPHKWCKFCPHLEKCLEQEDLKEGKKKNWYVLND